MHDVRRPNSPQKTRAKRGEARACKGGALAIARPRRGPYVSRLSEKWCLEWL